MSAATVLTAPKTNPHRTFTVLAAVLGVHATPNGEARVEPPQRGDTITRDEIEAVGGDVERLVGLRAIEPRILTLDQLPDPGPAVDRSATPPGDMITSLANRRK